MRRARATATCVFAIAAALAGVPAAAQSGEQREGSVDTAVDAMTQPLTDLGLRKERIPEILLAAQRDPYGLPGRAECGDIRAAVEAIDAHLGPDADAPEEDEGLFTRGLRAGGDVLGGFIPFRGLVRQISGASAHDARWEAAIYAGVARRSFLKGYLRGRDCLSAEEQSVQSARSVLGMDTDAGSDDLAPADVVAADTPSPANTRDIPRQLETRDPSDDY